MEWHTSRAAIPVVSPLFFGTELADYAFVIWPLHHPEGAAVNEPPHGAVFSSLAALFFVESRMTLRRLSFGRFANGCAKRLAIWNQLPSRAVIPVVSPLFLERTSELWSLSLGRFITAWSGCEPTSSGAALLTALFFCRNQVTVSAFVGPIM